MITQGHTSTAIPHTTHVPLPVGTVTHRKIERRNTSPFPPQKRLYGPELARAQKDAAKRLAAIDKKRKRGRGPDIQQRTSRANWDVDAAIARYEAGESCADIGRSIGKDAKTIYSALAYRGVKMRGRRHRRGPSFDLAAAIADAPTHLMAELEAKYGVDGHTIRRWLPDGVRAQTTSERVTQRILEAAQHETTTTGIARRAKVSEHTVRKRLRRARKEAA